MFSEIPAATGTGIGATLRGVKCTAADALRHLAAEVHLTCHTGFLVDRLGLAAGASRRDARPSLDQRHLDVAELFAFVCPATTTVPTPKGIARFLSLSIHGQDDEILRTVAEELLRRLSNSNYPFLRETAEHANTLARANWPWAKPVMAALLKANPRMDVGTFATGLNVWDRLEEWEDDGGRPQGRNDAISPDETTAILREALGLDAEARPAQRAYAAAATFAFAPREAPTYNNILLAEAGTGLGKTLGYLSPAWGWSKKNARPVWLSTYTKNLQRQLEQETHRVIPDPDERRARVVIRKGRENYLCLLNM
jgi:ATP-dependent DNA helicase DinG